MFYLQQPQDIYRVKKTSKLNWIKSHHSSVGRPRMLLSLIKRADCQTFFFFLFLTNTVIWSLIPLDSPLCSCWKGFVHGVFTSVCPLQTLARRSAVWSVLFFRSKWRLCLKGARNVAGFAALSMVLNKREVHEKLWSRCLCTYLKIEEVWLETHFSFLRQHCDLLHCQNWKWDLSVGLSVFPHLLPSALYSAAASVCDASVFLRSASLVSILRIKNILL